MTAVALVAGPMLFGQAPIGAALSRTRHLVSTKVTVPNSPVGVQLNWLLSVTQLPIPTYEVKNHFDATFLAQAPPSQLNSALSALSASGALKLVGLEDLESTSLVAVVEFGPTRYKATVAVDSSGLIAELVFRPDNTLPTTWAAVEHQLAAVAPGTSLLAAKVNADGTCTPVHQVRAATPRPLGSMFKLFVLGALANAIRDHTVSWTQTLTVTPAVKVGGSGTLQKAADGTTLTVQQVANKMISVSDNTAADMLVDLVGRAAVERQVRQWSSHPGLDTPFLTVQELFTLKYHDFPTLAQHYLRLKPATRARYLGTTIDPLGDAGEHMVTSPRDIGSIEWFASADDLCRAFAGLASLKTKPGLSPLGTVLSTNNGGIQLSPMTWPTIWFKGGSEPGVLTLGYLARDVADQTYVVIAQTENTRHALALDSTTNLLAVVAGAFGLLHHP